MYGHTFWFETDELSTVFGASTRQRKAQLVLLVWQMPCADKPRSQTVRSVQTSKRTFQKVITVLRFAHRSKHLTTLWDKLPPDRLQLSPTTPQPGQKKKTASTACEWAPKRSRDSNNRRSQGGRVLSCSPPPLSGSEPAQNLWLWTKTWKQITSLEGPSLHPEFREGRPGVIERRVGHAAQGGGQLEVELARNWELWHPETRGGREGGEARESELLVGGLLTAGKS